ncbi:hypothetical protein Aglo03_06790 [Actinokineospora globicatena]|uniref:Fatty acid desaturase domain-containing protein n=2 Tax=Actinokineospora globicatena TaxID=103729 RepID=A0A9W6QKH5_9PSEU|nr:hypothetical protein Aglo03_06790 [Actinokineospora globicatena]
MAQEPAASGYGPVVSDEVRESMRRLPAAFQLPLTLLTGKPLAEQRRIRFTPTRHLLNAVFSMLVGVVIGVLALRISGWALVMLLPGWAMTLHGMRNLRMMIYHQCAHRNMWGRRKLDAALGRFVAALLVVQNFRQYSTEHVSEHHALHHMTLRDPTVQAFLVGLRLHAGMPSRLMWRRVLAKLFSPRFHLAFLIGRVRSYAQSCGPVERVCAIAAAVAVAAVAIATGTWLYLAVVWILPLTVFYQISNTLRLCVKHTFPRPDQTERRGHEYFATLTNAIFIGEATPDRDLRAGRRFAAWVRWCARMLCVHFPARYLVLTGDTVCHDFHHRQPMSRRWADYIFERAADAAKQSPGRAPYRHVWGLAQAMDTVFRSLSAADPAEYDPARLAAVNRRELFAAFDD